MTMPRIIIAMPSRGQPNWLAFRNAEMYALKMGALVQRLQVFVGEPVETARNKLVEVALQGDATHVWFIDDDTLVPGDIEHPAHKRRTNALCALLDLDADIATGVTPILRNGIQLRANVVRAGGFVPGATFEQRFPRLWPVGIFPVNGCGMSCALIKAGVFKRLEKEPGFVKSRWFRGGNDRPADTGEDLDFCIRARNCGLSLMCDAAIRCGHIKWNNLADLAQFNPDATEVESSGITIKPASAFIVRDGEYLDPRNAAVRTV